MSEPSQESEKKTAPAATADAARLVYLDAAKLHFFRHGAALRLTVADDRSYLKVSVVRAFPLSEPQRYFSVRDAEKKEIGLLIEPGALAPDQRRLLEDELARRYVMPVIRRILAVKDRFGTVEWEVETDRGRCTFATRDLREAVVRPAPERYILPDVEGNRYDVPDVRALDVRSREWLARHV